MMYEMWYKYIQILISYEITINLDYVLLCISGLRYNKNWWHYHIWYLYMMKIIENALFYYLLHYRADIR